MAQYQSTSPQGMPPQGMVEDPGKTLGIVGFVLAFVAPLVGLILSIVARRQSTSAGFDNGLAKAGVIIGAVLTALSIIGIIIYIVAIAAVVRNGSYPG